MQRYQLVEMMVSEPARQPVRVPFANVLSEWTSHGPIVKVLEEVWFWLDERPGEWSVVEWDGYDTGDANTALFEFTDPLTAVEFKLRWG